MTSDRSRQRLRADLEKHEGILSTDGLELLDDYDDIVLLESVRPDGMSSSTILFDTLIDTVWADRVHEVVPALVRLQVWLERGYHVAGYLTYEAAPAFLPVPVRDPEDSPTHLLWFGVYDRPLRIPRSGFTVPVPRPGRDHSIGQIRPSITRNTYLKSAARVRSYLERGHTYQVNLTFPVEGRWTGSSVELYSRLRAVQPVPYSAFIRNGDAAIVSLSPELFFRLDGRQLTLKPMKGTARRGRTRQEDEERRAELTASEKDRAENRMIVDLLRSDAGRLAQAGTVKVESFFDIEQHPTVFQATSTISARMRDKPNMVDVFRALFPCGSVTGAPKVETMRIINELERSPRGVYTGAIGYWGPDGRAAFSVAIRTLVSKEVEGSFRLGIGSGITIASDSSKEFEECLLKAKFVESEPLEFRLIETMRWESGTGVQLLDEHLSRLCDSAEYFGWHVDPNTLREAVNDETRTLALSRHSPSAAWRVKLVVGPDGSFQLECTPLEPTILPVVIGLARKRISSNDRFQYHKTTLRPLYTRLLGDAERRGWFDAIVLNEEGEVAEGCRTNVVIRRGDRYLTPPISAGILPGVYRQSLLKSRHLVAHEVPLRPDDLKSADDIFVCNALRGLMPARLVF